MNDTFPKLLIHNADRFANRTAIREKDMGIWQSWTWKETRDEIFLLANGLVTIGFGRGDKLAIAGANRPRMYWGICAAQCLGGIPVPIYADSVAVEVLYVLNHAGVSHILAEDQEQVDKILEVMPDCETLSTANRRLQQARRQADSPTPFGRVSGIYARCVARFSGSGQGTLPTTAL